MIQGYSDFSLASIMLYLSIWAFQQTFITSAIMLIRTYKNRTELVLEKVIGTEDAFDVIPIIVYCIFLFVPIYFIYLMLIKNLYLGFIFVILSVFFSFFIMIIPLRRIKKIAIGIRFPWIVYKNKIYNLLTPISTLSLAIILIILGLLLR